MQNLTFNAQNEVIDATEKGKNDLKILAQNYQFSEIFILENADFLDWNIISENQKLTIGILVKCAKKIKWAKINFNPNLDNNPYLLAKYKGNMNKMVERNHFSEDFLRKYKHLIDYHFVLTNYLSNDFLEEFSDNINWKYVFKNDRKSEDFLRKNLFRIDAFNEQEQTDIWIFLARSQSFSEQFLMDFEHKIDFKNVANRTTIESFSLDFIRQHQDKWTWMVLGYNKRFSEDFLIEFAKKWQWQHDIAYFQRVSESFLRKYIKKFNQIGWINLSEKQQLSESFIEDYQDKVTWWMISMYQTLSENFIRKFQNRVDWEKIFVFQELSPAFQTEFQHKKPTFTDANLMEQYTTYAYEMAFWGNKSTLEENAKEALKVLEKAFFYKSKINTKINTKNLPDKLDSIKAKILLALNQKQEAFAIIKWALEIYNNFEEFQNFKTDKDYLEWLKNN